MARIAGIVLILFVSVAGSLPVYAQDGASSLTPSEITLVAETRHLLETYASEAWPGWDESAPPILLRKGDFDYWIGTSDPPESFVEVPGLMIGDAPVFRAEGHLVPVPAATSWQVGDQWVVAVPVRDEFQQAINDLLGEGVLTLDDAAYVRSVVHEAFHAHHLATFGDFSQMPDFVQASDDSWLKNLSEVDQAALDEALIREGQALYPALELDASEEKIRAAVAEFLRLRTDRRASLPPEAANYERSTEWIEGAARYADVRLMLLAGQPDYEGAISYLPEADMWEQYREQLTDLSLVPGGYRDYFYVLGSAQMFVLDRLMPGWQTRLWEDGIAVEDLLAEGQE